jgi:hypothetical protein
MTESGRTLWLPCCCWHVLVVMTRLAEEGCCAALPASLCILGPETVLATPALPGSHACSVAAYTYGVAISN